MKDRSLVRSIVELVVEPWAKISGENKCMRLIREIKAMQGERNQSRDR